MNNFFYTIISYGLNILQSTLCLLQNPIEYPESYNNINSKFMKKVTLFPMIKTVEFIGGSIDEKQEKFIENILHKLKFNFSSKDENEDINVYKHLLDITVKEMNIDTNIFPEEIKIYLDFELIKILQEPVPFYIQDNVICLKKNYDLSLKIFDDKTTI